MTFGTVLGQALWLSVSVALSGIIHMVVVKKGLLASLQIPLDGGRSIGGERIFGDNKTWRGVVFMIAAPAILGALQGFGGGSWADAAGAAPLDFAALGQRLGAGADRLAYSTGYAAVNAVLGVGYVLGELPNSFVKRRLGIHPGDTGLGVKGLFFLIVDQADSVVAALLLAVLLFGLNLYVFVVGSVALTVVHLGLNIALYLARVRRKL